MSNFDPPASFTKFMDALVALATAEDHPHGVTAATVFALMMGKMAKKYLYEDDFLHSPQLTALLTELSGVLGPPGTVESLRTWLVDIIEIMPMSGDRSFPRVKDEPVN
ncbi:MAG TPA: hypothetical protein VGS01_11425 [Candidatus Limnocylindria bacterium]|nr:hypothetical protein [Candidatus Limnocylindria bacterium]